MWGVRLRDSQAWRAMEGTNNRGYLCSGFRCAQFTQSRRGDFRPRFTEHVSVNPFPCNCGDPREQKHNGDLPSKTDPSSYFPLKKCGRENTSAPSPIIKEANASQRGLCPLSPKNDTNKDNTQKAMS